MLIDGHLRTETDPAGMIPTLVLDVDEVEAGKLLATFDPLAAMAEADGKKLDALLQDVEINNEAVQAMLAALAEEAGIVPPDQPDAPESFPVVDENIDVEHSCPKCGYQWSGGQ